MEHEASKYDDACNATAHMYHHRDAPAFEEVYRHLIDQGVPAAAIARSPKMQRLCARLDPRPPPCSNAEGFTHFLMCAILCELPGTLRTKTPVKPTLTFVQCDDAEHQIQVEFPSLTHWSLFAYNKRWREAWMSLAGAPRVKLPTKWSLKVGKYLGSWADAADSEEEE